MSDHLDGQLKEAAAKLVDASEEDIYLYLQRIYNEGWNNALHGEAL